MVVFYAPGLGKIAMGPGAKSASSGKITWQHHPWQSWRLVDQQLAVVFDSGKLRMDSAQGGFFARGCGGIRRWQEAVCVMHIVMSFPLVEGTVILKVHGCRNGFFYKTPLQITNNKLAPRGVPELLAFIEEVFGGQACWLCMFLLLSR
jgi:hypothetical protein